MKDNTVAIAHTFNVGGEVEADGSVPNGIHGLGIKEVMGSRWRVGGGGGGRQKTGVKSKSQTCTHTFI